jgi:putative ABC transport system ATP-binding protein
MNENQSNNGALVRVENVEKIFHRGSEDIHVLADLQLQVPAGEFLALMGPSGSGKSTLLNLIGGLDRPTSGIVTVAGERLDQLSDHRLAAWRARHVGFVFQLYNLMPVLTAERNVELPLLLCDEPTGDLDRKAGNEILDLLQALNREHGKTIIMVTHDPHASARASRTVYLDKGQLSNEPVK